MAGTRVDGGCQQRDRRVVAPELDHRPRRVGDLDLRGQTEERRRHDQVLDCRAQRDGGREPLVGQQILTARRVERTVDFSSARLEPPRLGVATRRRLGMAAVTDERAGPQRRRVVGAPRSILRRCERGGCATAARGCRRRPCESCTPAGESSAYNLGNGGRCFGEAWREELAFDDFLPTPLELAAWLAATGDNYPKPRPYCPDLFVGTGQQRVEGSAPHWQFAADGTFICDEPVLRIRIRWCLHRQSANRPVGDVLWLDDELGIAHKYLLILAVSSTELHLRLPGTRTEYRLVRL